VRSAIGITLGDPTGIGPELVVRLLADPQVRAAWDGAAAAPVRIYGDAGLLHAAAAALGLPWPPQRAEIVEVTRLLPYEAPPGRPTLRSGAAQVAYLEAALRDAASGGLGGLCTAPIHKASAIAAGLPFPGHTELLAARLLARPDEVVMMLAGPSLRVALCTTHLPLAEVPQALSVEGVTQVLRTTALSLQQDFGVSAPRLLVAGLNPHAGEEGHFGTEEQTVIAPAIARARALPELQALPGLSIEGPEVPDAVFRAAVLLDQEGRQGADAVVAMYHDQGLIPLKLLDFDHGVNITLGLPIVRTSPDHGVAHDLAAAGIGKARPDSMAAALRLCAEVMGRRSRRAPAAS
jgi:4-hydroxythreonine-4-phosphate dehydrogenase